MAQPPRSWQVLIVGGPSGVGKTSVSYRLAHHFGVGITEIDDFQVLLEAMTTPEQQPALHFWRIHPAPEQLTADEISPPARGIRSSRGSAPPSRRFTRQEYLMHEQPRSAVLPVHEVIARVRAWVTLHASQLPGFAGAYLWAGITALPSDAPFALYRDVDVVVVLAALPAEDTGEVFFQGLMIEVIYKTLDDHRDADLVLADPSAGPNLATTQILADPTGILLPLQQQVAAQYREPRWIAARCAAARQAVQQQLANMRQTSDPGHSQDALWQVWGLLNGLSSMLAVAQLARPTTRRTLALLGELLTAHERPDLHELALAVWGSAQLSRAEVQAMLDQSVDVFDRAVVVVKTPTPFGFTIRAHLRPYLQEATQELIDAGQHREATFWIVTLVTEAYLVLANDAPADERPAYAAQLRTVLDALGYTSAQAWDTRVAAAERLTHEVVQFL